MNSSSLPSTAACNSPCPSPTDGKLPQMLKVEEGHYEGARWVAQRLWNGDETDYGLNFGGKGSLLRITLGSY